MRPIHLKAIFACLCIALIAMVAVCIPLAEHKASAEQISAKAHSADTCKTTVVESAVIVVAEESATIARHPLGKVAKVIGKGIVKAVRLPAKAVKAVIPGRKCNGQRCECCECRQCSECGCCQNCAASSTTANCCVPVTDGKKGLWWPFGKNPPTPAPTPSPTPTPTPKPNVAPCGPVVENGGCATCGDSEDECECCSQPGRRHLLRKLGVGVKHVVGFTGRRTGRVGKGVGKAVGLLFRGRRGNCCE